VAPARTDAELREAVNRYQVCWEVFPELAGANHDRKQVGFAVELFGTHNRTDIVPAAGCKHCIPVLQALLDIADYAVPDQWHDALDGVRAHSGIQYAKERGGRPDIVVVITMVPKREGQFEAGAIAPCLAAVEERLGSLGACERSWRQDHGSGSGYRPKT
jgi:hypothetical protein